ncbi:hypothetical protein AAE478_003061 [Parahypoxylon ruwenzoriense]
MAESSSSTSGPASPLQFPLPRITIRFCTQCKWMLRAAYFAQELLSTFSTSLGEVALQPSTGGTFIVEIYYSPLNPSTTSSSEAAPSVGNLDTDAPVHTHHRVLWDRKLDGGFPETKELKRRVRDAIEPGRDLGHVDRHSSTTARTPSKPTATRSDTQAGATAPSNLEDKHKTENSLGLNTHPEEAVGGPACKPGAENAQEECEDCK